MVFMSAPNIRVSLVVSNKSCTQHRRSWGCSCTPWQSFSGRNWLDLVVKFGWIWAELKRNLGKS